MAGIDRDGRNPELDAGVVVDVGGDTRGDTRGRMVRGGAYGIAVLMVLAATAIRMVDYRPLAGALPFLTYFPAVIIAALYGGRGPGLLATLLSVVSSVFWLERPGVAMSWNLSAVGGELMFAGVCLFIVWICGSVRGARERTEAGVATQSRLAAIVDSSDDAIVSKNLNGIVKSWNAAAARLFGYTPEEIIGTSIERLIPPDRAGEEEEILERIRRGESVDHFETVRVRKDGKRVEVSVTISPLRDGTGRVVGASKIARDIGERRQGEAERLEAKRAVDASLAQLQAVVGSMSEGLIVADPQRNLLQMNRAALKMHGLSSAEEMGRNVEGLAKVFELRQLGGAELALADWPIMRVLRGETVEHVEVEMRRRQGGMARILSCSGTALVDVEGRVTLGVLTLHDLTEERAAQDSLKMQAQRLNLAMETAELGDWAWDAATDAMTISPRVAAIFGVPAEARMTREEMRGLVHEEDRDATRVAAARAARLHEDYDMEYRVNRPDGRQVWVAALGRGQYAKDGTIIGMLGIVQDITQRKEAEVALRESEERLRLGLEAGNTGTWDWDLLRDQVTWSERVYEFHGLRPGEFSGRVEDFTKLVHPDDVERVRDAIHAALENREPYHIEFRVVHRSGEVRWISTNGKVYFNDEGRPIRMLGATTDVTARKQAEAERDRLLEVERHARAEAERSSRMKDEFLATLSHELRTPLNAILGWSQLLGRGGGGDPGTLEEGLAVIERNTRAQAQLIDDLLDMSRIISGKIRLDIHSINPAGFIHAAVETVTPAASAKGIGLQLELDEQAGPIPGDASRLQQVVWNLLSNAIKFTPRGGRVTVSLARGASAVEISVTDTGQGIALDFLPHVFERFRQADASSTRRHGGLGLGLAIVKQIVELHGGTIQASSQGEGHGSTFRIDLPLAGLTDQGREEAEAKVEAEAEAMQGSRMAELPRESNELAGLKVLVVDDEPDALRLVRKLLEGCGSKVLAASSAEEALELVESQRPDVLISDVGMPEVDGYELLRRVRALGAEKGGRVPAIALTAFARSEDRTRALLAGFLVHVSKPVEPDELVATVASVAGRTGLGVG